MGLGSFFSALYLGVLFLYVLFCAIFGIIVSLIFRPYVLWYFKINKRIELQEETNHILNEILSQNVKTTSDHQQPTPTFSSSAASVSQSSHENKSQKTINDMYKR